MIPNSSLRTAMLNIGVIPSLLLAWTLVLEDRLVGRELEYGDYPVPSVFRGHPARPKFKQGVNTWPDADPRFRETVGLDTGKGPSFAGAYTVVSTTCGTGCFYVVIVDIRTGEIFENLPFRMVVVGRPNEYRGLFFRLDSRLLMVEGFVDGSRIPTRSYYEWVGTRFRLIQAIKLRATSQ
jgi:hypothetical protein